MNMRTYIIERQTLHNCTYMYMYMYTESTEFQFGQGKVITLILCVCSGHASKGCHCSLFHPRGSLYVVWPWVQRKCLNLESLKCIFCFCNNFICINSSQKLILFYCKASKKILQFVGQNRNSTLTFHEFMVCSVLTSWQSVQVLRSLLGPLFELWNVTGNRNFLHCRTSTVKSLLKEDLNSHLRESCLPLYWTQVATFYEDAHACFDSIIEPSSEKHVQREMALGIFSPE